MQKWSDVECAVSPIVLYLFAIAILWQITTEQSPLTNPKVNKEEGIFIGETGGESVLKALWI